ncbi:MAG: FxsA family protein [Candidatus Nanopelagicales bacterium]|nr:FxsA family protein [Candidatus Nanopelagicales bacterium]
MRRRLLVFGYPLLEICTFWAFVVWLGWAWAILIYVAGFPIGIGVFKSGGRMALESAQRSALPTRLATFRMLAGVLFMVPGFWTDVLAVACFIPWVQRRLASPMQNFSSPAGGVNWRMSTWGSGSEVVEGVVIREDDDPFDPRSIERLD